MDLKHANPETSDASARLNEIFRHCSADLHRYLQRRLRRTADVPDLSQEIFARFLQGDWQTRARNPIAYLFGIASNVIADARTAERREVVTYDSEISSQAGEAMTAAGSVDADNVELQDELTRALDQLPEMHRLALLLTKRDGLSGKEAAARMGIGEASVRVYVCEARAKLKILLQQDAG
ncbi:RNA polymerase sigma factor [Peristeroidobacter soli]|uniref:RNA polymerase sigma factor n=1 Tax=Peristeroidobacter soli TaxID=2497877 RepID=UPI00130070C1|nr:RNA polymerase sigma factor [Peristeroidobacter soli]